jgi:hypothetical protein
LDGLTGWARCWQGRAGQGRAGQGSTAQALAAVVLHCLLALSTCPLLCLVRSSRAGQHRCLRCLGRTSSCYGLEALRLAVDVCVCVLKHYCLCLPCSLACLSTSSLVCFVYTCCSLCSYRPYQEGCPFSSTCDQARPAVAARAESSTRGLPARLTLPMRVPIVCVRSFLSFFFPFLACSFVFLCSHFCWSCSHTPHQYRAARLETPCATKRGQP